MIATLQSRWIVALAAALALAQIAVLGSMIWGRAAILRSGTEVVLEVRPIDPRDLLRGDYVTVGYTISTLSRSLFAAAMPEDYSGPHVVFVRLKAGDGGLWEPVSARFADAAGSVPSPGEVDLRGTVSFIPAGGGDLPAEYGIERFYLPEGQGRPIEQGIGQRPFRMKLAVAADGTAQIKSFHDGEDMIFAEPLY